MDWKRFICDSFEWTNPWAASNSSRFHRFAIRLVLHVGNESLKLGRFSDLLKSLILEQHPDLKEAMQNRLAERHDGQIGISLQCIHGRFIVKNFLKELVLIVA